MKVAIIGAGAAGCFCAIELKRRLPAAEVEVFEKGRRPLAKVAITGGGRCNLTNSFEGISSLSEVYPRGDRLMKRVFREFDHKDTWNWFEAEGVSLVLQEDRCVFPASQDAMQIVGLLTARMRQLGVVLHLNHRIDAAAPLLDEYDAVVVTTGGSPREEGLRFLEGLDLEFIPPVPSLFSFNLQDSPVRQLTGTVAENTATALAGTKFRASGPLLITHWGMSGPAILKLSSHAARYLADNGYRATLLVNWLDQRSEQEVRERVASLADESPQKMAVNSHPEEIPSRLWEYLVVKSGIRAGARWAEVGAKGINRLVNTLMNDEYKVLGKSRFKEEFVTCGGVSLNCIDQNTLASKANPRLFFAGEILDVDAVTGGFNLQAAWSTGRRAAMSIQDIAR